MSRHGDFGTAEQDPSTQADATRLDRIGALLEDGCATLTLSKDDVGWRALLEYGVPVQREGAEIAGGWGGDVRLALDALEEAVFESDSAALDVFSLAHDFLALSYIARDRILLELGGMDKPPTSTSASAELYRVAFRKIREAGKLRCLRVAIDEAVDKLELTPRGRE